MLHYKVQGEGNPIVFIHGYLENMTMWENYANKLSTEYQVITIDLPGHGQSPEFGEIHTMELMAEKVNETLDAIGIKEALIIGHSMGGYVTLALTEQFTSKVKAFVLMNSSSLADTEEKKELRLRAIEMADENMATLVKISIPLLFNENTIDNFKSAKEFVKKMALSTPIEGVKAALKGMRIRPDRTNVLDNFKGEMGIILGTFDRTVPIENFKKAIPQRENISQLELITGHMAFIEEELATFIYLQNFAKRIFEK